MADDVVGKDDGANRIASEYSDRPSQGDAVLVGSLAGGKQSDISGAADQQHDLEQDLAEARSLASQWEAQVETAKKEVRYRQEKWQREGQQMEERAEFAKDVLRAEEEREESFKMDMAAAIAMQAQWEATALELQQQARKAAEEGEKRWEEEERRRVAAEMAKKERRIKIERERLAREEAEMSAVEEAEKREEEEQSLSSIEEFEELDGDDLDLLIDPEEASDHRAGLEILIKEVHEIATRIFQEAADALRDYDGDHDLEVWRRFRRELVVAGFSSDVLARHKGVLQSYIRDLERDRYGLVDEMPESTKSMSSANQRHDKRSPQASSSVGGGKQTNLTCQFWLHGYCYYGSSCRYRHAYSNGPGSNPGTQDVEMQDRIEEEMPLLDKTMEDIEVHCEGEGAESSSEENELDGSSNISLMEHSEFESSHSGGVEAVAQGTEQDYHGGSMLVERPSPWHKRGVWAQNEDAFLRQLTVGLGPFNWVRIAMSIGSHSPKQCRERYYDAIKPELDHAPMTQEEATKVERLVSEIGEGWEEIARTLPGRSANQVKSWWNGTIRVHYSRTVVYKEADIFDSPSRREDLQAFSGLAGQVSPTKEEDDASEAFRFGYRVANIQRARDDDRLSETSDVSAASSLKSIADSVFSTISGSSMSSLPGRQGAGERLVSLLLDDPAIKQLCSEALLMIEQEKLERNLRRLLNGFAIELRKEAETTQQRHAANFVRFRARNSAHMICNSLTKDLRPVMKPKVLQEANQAEEDDHGSEDEDSDRSDDEVQNLQQLEGFIKSSAAFEVFREKLRAFVFPSEKGIERKKVDLDRKQEREEDRDDNDREDKHKAQYDSVNGENTGILNRDSNDIGPLNSSWTSGTFNLLVNLVVTSLTNEQPLIAPGKTRIEWKCKCGHTIYDDFIELKSGGAERLKQTLEQSTKTANSSNSSRAEYHATRRKWTSMFSLRTLSWIKFVKFELYCSELVDVRKVDDIPPPEHVEYRYAPAPPEVIPPVGHNHLMHLFHSPHCASPTPHLLTRFPKKLLQPLAFLPNLPPTTSLHPTTELTQGWGLQYLESWNFPKIWLLLFVLFGIGSALIGVLWCVYRHSVQDAFAIAGYFVALGAAGVGSLQVWVCL